MTSEARTLWLICGVSAIAMGCGQPLQTPAAPIGSSTTVIGETILGGFDSGGAGEPVRFDLNAASQAANGGKASGHAEVEATPTQNARIESYSFTAIPDGEPPLAKGQVQVHLLRFTGEELWIHGEVTCASVVGNHAWVGGRATRLMQDGEEIPVDLRLIFRVEDNGEAAPTTDRASLVFFGPAGLDLTHCNTQQEFPQLRASTTGNIQVKAD